MSFRSLRSCVWQLGCPLSDTLVKATPLILVGLACTVAFRMKLWNIGAEGQFYIGAFFASLVVVLLPIVPADSSRQNDDWHDDRVWHDRWCAVGLHSGFQGALPCQRNHHDVDAQLYRHPVEQLLDFSKWSDAGFQMTPVLTRQRGCLCLADYAREFVFFSGMTLHFGFVIALIVNRYRLGILSRSKWGFEIKLIGDNPEAARYSGINIARNIVLVMMFSGAVGGSGGMSEITGVVHRLQERISPGYGFTGIIIAWLAKLNPFAVVLVSFYSAA